MQSRTFCLLGIAALTVLAIGNSAVASTITFGTGVQLLDTTTIPTNTIDWMLVDTSADHVNRKAGGSTIVGITAPSWYGGDASYPTFTYTDGTDPTSATAQRAAVGYCTAVAGSTVVATLNVAAGDAIVKVFGNGPAGTTLTAAFADGASATAPFVQAAEGVGSFSAYPITVSSTTAQTLTLTMNAPDNPGNPGWGGGLLGVSMSQVPEPATIYLIASGTLSLLAYAWRKRR